MPMFRKQQTTDDRGAVLVAEVTTGQAVIFLCLALVLLGAAFIAGRLVARVERPIDIAAQPAAQGTVKTVESAAAPVAAAAKGAAPKTAPVKSGPTQTYTIPAMEAGAGTPAPSAQPAPTAAPAPAKPATATPPAPVTPTPAAPVPAAPAAAVSGLTP